MQKLTSLSFPSLKGTHAGANKHNNFTAALPSAKTPQCASRATRPFTPACSSSSNTATRNNAQFRTAGPTEPAPCYVDLDAQPVNAAIMGLFRQKMVVAVGQESDLHGYSAIMDLTRKLNSKCITPESSQHATRAILQSLFPSWLPSAFKVMFSKPLPALSCRLNAWVTALTCQWLMGPSKVNDVERPDGTIAKGHGVLVERCRYLEEAQCASVCVNNCKIPTQEFFLHDMGLPLTMTPNYDDFSCQFAFGTMPPPTSQDEAFQTSCFVQCSSKRNARQLPCHSISLPE